MMTAARLEEIRNKWQGGVSDFATDVRDLLSALDAHREAVRVAAEVERMDAVVMARGRDGDESRWDRYIDREYRENHILAAAIKSAQESQQ